MERIKEVSSENTEETQVSDMASVENKNDVAELVEKELVYKVDLYHDGKMYVRGTPCKVDAKTQEYFEKNGLVETK